MADSPTQEEIKERAEMSASCLGMIREMLEGLGIDMTRCPPMFYPEAIKNLYVWTAWASRDCERAHQWHGGIVPPQPSAFMRRSRSMGQNSRRRTD